MTGLIYQLFFVFFFLSDTVFTEATKQNAGVTNTDDMGYIQKLIPDEVLLKICLYVQPKDLCRLACTCQRLYELCEDTKLW